MQQKRPLDHIRHSLAHLLAASVCDQFPGAKLGVGPVIENGFYYDFLLPRAITPQDLPRIEKLMKRKISQNTPFTGEKIPMSQARNIFSEQPFKLELLDDIEKFGTTDFDTLLNARDKKPPTTLVKEVTIYRTGSFLDLCRGGHVKETREIPADSFSLTHTAGAYWRGDEKNPMLTRIYGVAFATKKDLVDYLAQQALARERDHRKVGEALHLFAFSDLVGKGLPMLTEEGATIRRELERYIVDEEIAWGYQHVITPPLAKVDLFKTSGHYPYYKDSMYPIMRVDEEELLLRPMTCPHHFSLFQSDPHSYRELPVRFAEISPQFRYEKSGELSGLMRVRMFTLADAHIFCRKTQVESEVLDVLKLIDSVNGTLGLVKGKDYRYRLSLGDRKDTKKYYKDDAAWDHAENILRKVLKKMKAPFVEAEGEAAFYGPKIDVQLTKVNGQEETAFTVQYDFVLPKRFDLHYTNEAGKDEQPIVIHRSSIGCLERTIAFLIEHYGGNFPVWLAPIQVGIIPVGKGHVSHCTKLAKEFRAQGLRVKVYADNETVGYKIRQATKKKIPYILVIGDKEMKSSKLHIRDRGTDKIRLISLKKFVEEVKKKIAEKSLK